MNMRAGLQAISAERIETALMAHIGKINSLPEGRTELEQQERNYPGLAHIPVALYEALLNSGFSKDQAELSALGASIAVNLVIEIAEVEGLPRLDP